jgi:hypothetical protein
MHVARSLYWTTCEVRTSIRISFSFTTMRALFVSLIAAFQALAIILPQPQPISIQLTKRSTLGTADGHVDPASTRTSICNTET